MAVSAQSRCSDASRAGGLRLARWGAACALAGTLLSGPLAVTWVSAAYPQPTWAGAVVFAAHYHPAQMLPYLFGFLIVGGFVLLMAGLAAAAPPDLRARGLAALAFTVVFAALVFLNYVLQTAYVPELLRTGMPDDAPLIGAFSMGNPSSLAWGLEMSGYGHLGVACLFIAGVFRGAGLPRATAWLFRMNGVASIVGALLTIPRLDWVMAPVGLAVFAGWNALVVALLVATLLVLARWAEPRT